MRLCAWCEKNEVQEPYWSCDECIKSREVERYHIDVPLKGSERYYKERWFRKDQKTWEADIKSRRSATPDGAVVHRVNESGERVG